MPDSKLVAEFPTTKSPFVEYHYTVAQIAKMWQLSSDSVRRLFGQEPGVVDVGNGRRAMLRVPQSVLDRVHEKRSRGRR